MEKPVWHLCNISSEEEFVEFLETKGSSFLSSLSSSLSAEEESLLRLIANRLHYAFFQFFRWFIWQERWRNKIRIDNPQTPPKYTGVKHADVKGLVKHHLPSFYQEGRWSRFQSLIESLVDKIYDHREHADYHIERVFSKEDFKASLWCYYKLYRIMTLLSTGFPLSEILLFQGDDRSPEQS